MALAEVQRMMAALYTDQDTRRNFADDPSDVCRSFNLTSLEKDESFGLSIQQISYFASSLGRKRLHIIEALLPRTRLALGAELDRRFADYLSGGSWNSRPGSAEDARYFVEYLLRELRTQIHPRRLLSEVVKLDAAELEMQDASRRFLVRQFRSPVIDMEWRTWRQCESGDRRMPRTVVVWFRVTRRSPLRRLILSIPTC